MFWNKHKPRLWDTFLFGDELDILECRLTEYADTDVYRHVIVEADKDHQGHRKPLYFQENMDRFAPFLDRIIHVPVKLTADGNWGRLAEQRNAVSRGLKNTKRDDVILFSDADEILSPDGISQALEYAPQMRKGVLFNQRHAVFCVDWEENSMPWRGPIAKSQRVLPEHLADIRYMPPSYVLESGWHLSWLGGPESIKLKTTQYCHPELTNYIWQNLDRLLKDGYYWGPNPPDTFNTKLTAVAGAEDWPRWVREQKCPYNWFRKCYSESRSYERGPTVDMFKMMAARKGVV